MKTISLILMIAVGLLSIAGCSRESLNMNEATATHQETIALEGGSPVVLDVRSGVGEVIVRGAETDSIHVEYKLTAYGKTQADADRELETMRVTFSHEAGAVTINAVQEKRGFQGQSNKVDLTITVPRTINLLIQNNVGRVEARGLRTPEQLQVSTDVGEIVLREIEAAPQTRVTGNVGDITFEGSLSGGAEITTDVGELNVRLADDTAAQVDARTGVGSIAVRDLATSDRSLTKHIPGAALTATLGSGGPALTLSANVGDITLGKL